MLYDSNVIKFDLIIHDVINEKRYILVIKKDNIIMFTHHNDNDKDK